MRWHLLSRLVCFCAHNRSLLNVISWRRTSRTISNGKIKKNAILAPITSQLQVRNEARCHESHCRSTYVTPEKQITFPYLYHRCIPSGSHLAIDILSWCSRPQFGRSPSRGCFPSQSQQPEVVNLVPFFLQQMSRTLTFWKAVKCMSSFILLMSVSQFRAKFCSSGVENMFKGNFSTAKILK